MTRSAASAPDVARQVVGAEEARRVDLVLDSDTYIGDLGFTDGSGRAVQGLYANRFTPEAFPLVLDEVRILFGCPAVAGDGCQGRLFDVVIIEDPDEDASPQTGARSVAVHPGTVASNDGETFTSIVLDPPVRLEGPGDIYVGFVPRWIESGTARVLPAARDDGSSAARSWALRWDGDPADPPVFPADFANTIGAFGANGSLKIRAFGFLPEAGACVPSATTLCLGESNRFEIRARFDTVLGGGSAGDGQATALAPLGVEDGGVFWFFDDKNPELLVKVLDACGLSTPRYWVFFAATTNVGFTLTVRDTVSGVEKMYLNPDLQQADAITDTDAFDTCAAGREPGG